MPLTSAQLAKTGDTMTGPLNLAAIQSATGVAAISIAASGVLSFPAMAQSLASNGYVKLPGGLIIQWAQGLTDTAGGLALQLPIAFPNSHLKSVATGLGANNAASVRAVSIEAIVANQTLVCYSAAAVAGQAIGVISIGH